MTTTTTPQSSRRTALLAATAAVPLATGLLALGPVAAADAADRPRARVTASVTDATPASGQTFRVSGRLTRGGDAITGRTVKVQTLRDGTWSDLTGARMATSSGGGYSLHVVLSQTGQRTLRVVGVLPGRNAFERFGVSVH